jgi:hypothetical protein
MVTIRTRLGMGSLVLVLTVAGCTDSLAPAPLPSSPSVASVIATVPTPTASVLMDVTLSGMVYEVVGDPPGQRRGIENVSVYCEPCGVSTHNFAYTDSKGEYVFPRGVWTEGRGSFPTRIWMTKDGYQDPPGLPKTTPPNPSGPGWREVLIAGNTRFEMELVRR